MLWESSLVLSVALIFATIWRWGAIELRGHTLAQYQVSDVRRVERPTKDRNWTAHSLSLGHPFAATGHERRNARLAKERYTAPNLTNLIAQFDKRPGGRGRFARARVSNPHARLRTLAQIRSVVVPPPD